MTEVHIRYENDQGEDIDYEVQIPYSRLHELLMAADDLVGDDD